MPIKKNVAAATGRNEPKPWKATLFQSPRLLLGVNCLEPGQVQALHEHQGQDKFYLVHEGQGSITVGAETVAAGPGDVVWAPAGVRHGVKNQGSGRLVLIVGIAPWA